MLDHRKAVGRRGAGLEQVAELHAGIHGRLDGGMGGVAEFDPGQVGLAAIAAGSGELIPLGRVERAGGQILGRVGDEHGQHGIGAVVTLDGGPGIGEELHLLARDAAQGVPLLDTGSTVHVHRHFRYAAIVVGRGGGVAVEDAEGVHARFVFHARTGTAGRVGGVAHAGIAARVRLILFRAEVGIPGRAAAGAGNPQAVHAGEIHLLDRVDRHFPVHGALAELGQGHGHGYLAIPVGAGTVVVLVFEVGHQIGGAAHVHQRVCVRGLGDERLAVHILEDHAVLVVDRRGGGAVGGLVGVGVGEQVDEGQGEGLAAAVGVGHLGRGGGVGLGAVGVRQAGDVGGGEFHRFDVGGRVEQVLGDLVQGDGGQAGCRGQGTGLGEAVDRVRRGEFRGISAHVDVGVGGQSTCRGLDELRNG